MCGLCILYAFFFIYETKGLALEDVDLLYESRIKPWHSRKWKPPVRDYWTTQERKASEHHIENLPAGNDDQVTV